MKVLVFGDSITQGFWDVAMGGWVARIRKHYDQKEQSTGRERPTIFNLGVSAHASDNLLDRIENETKARMNKEPIVIVIAIGVNDARIKTDGNYMEVNQYKDNLASLLKMARKYSDQVMFVGLTPCVDDLTHPVTWGSTVYDNSRIKEFDSALFEFCEANNVPIVEMYDAFSKEQAKRDLLPDGLHPNDDGHQFMADLILPKLEELVS